MKTGLRAIVFSTALTLLSATLAACGAEAVAKSPVAAPPAPQVRVDGAVNHPAGLSLADLQARPPMTQTATYLNGATPQLRTYTGAGLWTILDGAGIQANPAVKNDILNKYILATGADGYRVVFSVGELKPDLGARPSIVAYAETHDGVSSALTAIDAPARLTSPGDVKGGRYVSKLLRLDVRDSGSATAGTGGGASTQLTVTGAVVHPGTYNLAALKGLPVKMQVVGASTYTGVDLWYLLNTVAGLKADAGAKNPSLPMYVVATGSDGYKALVSLAEIDPSFGADPDLIAYSVNGAPLNGGGFARLVVPNDSRPSRFVSNLVNLEVFTAQTVPKAP